MAKDSKRSGKKRKTTGSRRQQVTSAPRRSRASRSVSRANQSNNLLKGIAWYWFAAAAVIVLAGAGLGVWYLLGPGRQPPAAVAPQVPVNPVDRADFYSAPPEMQIDTTQGYRATIVTAKGDIVLELDAAAAPQTVNNFVFLAQQGFYDGLTFHRVEPGFVIQGGDPLGSGVGGPGYTIPAEIGLPHIQGAIAMARTADEVNPERASSGSQFYIALEALPSLDGAYTVFGHVIEGMDVVNAIEIGDVIQTIEISQG